MAHVSSSHTHYSGNRPRVRCSHSSPKPIYDEPFVFRVRSDRSLSYSFPCRACLREAKLKQRESSTNVRYQQRCSRSPLRPVRIEHLNRPKTVSSIRTSNNCNWDNFMRKKSKHAVRTPYALCNLTKIQQESESRPPFVNYGGRYNDKQSGQKRTYNSFVVHQMKHDEIDDERVRSAIRERRLRREAEMFFRAQPFYDQYTQSADEYRNRDSRSSQS
ncbi:unnamed protein product [Rotaria socialis]|uniref:Uncharacterized protein n=2 Tax=Rotaria socialis TaxID=392032 RepID=A0A818MSV8_9BILA|nr:unnamed protein product [Rotaria socialis]CAF4475020.1 unnamed protein product [Rotaria socialis]